MRTFGKGLLGFHIEDLGLLWAHSGTSVMTRCMFGLQIPRLHVRFSGYLLSMLISWPTSTSYCNYITWLVIYCVPGSPTTWLNYRGRAVAPVKISGILNAQFRRSSSC